MSQMKCWGIERTLGRQITPGPYHFSRFVTIAVEESRILVICGEDIRRFGPEEFEEAEKAGLLLHRGADLLLALSGH